MGGHCSTLVARSCDKRDRLTLAVQDKSRIKVNVSGNYCANDAESCAVNRNERFFSALLHGVSEFTKSGPYQENEVSFIIERVAAGDPLQVIAAGLGRQARSVRAQISLLARMGRLSSASRRSYVSCAPRFRPALPPAVAKWLHYLAEVKSSPEFSAIADYILCRGLLTGRPLELVAVEFDGDQKAVLSRFRSLAGAVVGLGREETAAFLEALALRAYPVEVAQ